MTQAQYYKNLSVPEGKVDVVLDTDAYNEIDDQYAICYMLMAQHKLNVKGICAAPFQNHRASTPEEGMVKSYHEIMNLLSLSGHEEMKANVYQGSRDYLPNETTPVDSPAARFIAELAKQYDADNPLYIVAIGAITNIASALLMNPEMRESCVIIWLGGHGVHIPRAASEFNMMQDIAAARIIFGCGVPLVIVPCTGVVDRFTVSKYELQHWFQSNNAVCDYLCLNTITEAERYAKNKPWTRVIWDVVAVAWLLNNNEQFMQDKLISAPIPEYDLHYAFDETRHLVRYVYHVERDPLLEDLVHALLKLDPADIPE